MPDNSSERGARVDGGACARGGSRADGPEAGEEGTRAQGAKPGPATPEPDEFHALARELMARGCRFARFRPQHDVSASIRGLPAIMQVLLEADGPVSPGELARRTGVTDARVANALRTLEERGFVERRVARGDRRRVEVTLTEAGREDIARHSSEAERLVADFLREMGPDDARDLVRVFGRALEVLARRRREGRQMVPPQPEAPFDARRRGDRRDQTRRGE